MSKETEATRSGDLFQSSRLNTPQPGLIPGTKRIQVLGFPVGLTILLDITCWSRMLSQEKMGLFASWVCLGHPQCPFLRCHHSLKVYEGGAAEPSGAPGPHQHTYAFQEDHQTEPAAEAGGWASNQGEYVLGWGRSINEGRVRFLQKVRQLKLRVKDDKKMHHPSLKSQYWGLLC